MWIRQKPEVLDALREQAIIHSVESSNRIEGVTVTPQRLRPVVLGHARPRDRSEEELAGYRSALDWVFSRRRRVAVTPRLIQRLHTLAQGRSRGDAGEWKKRNNEIIEILRNGDRQVRFIPVSAEKTPAAVTSLCRSYADTLSKHNIPPLLVIATLLLDFLCIHPFRDGNGRVSRLLTSLLLQMDGFEVARYVSLERLIEESKEDYYRTLKLCSKGWHEGKNEIIPWWNYFLGIVRSGYREFERQVESAAARPAKSEAVRRLVLEQDDPFALADIAAWVPAVSPQLVKKVLAQMKEAGEVQLEGRGRGARWIRV